jgi:hypothetical protein
MRKYKILKKALLGVSVLLAGGTVLSNGCMNTVASINLCGTVFTFCTPGDQLSLFWPYLEIPDYEADPSCTIPMGCGGQPSTGSDLFPAIPGAPGGLASEQPSDTQGSGVGGGGGGGI